MWEGRLLERDYYPPTKLIGSIVRKMSATSSWSRIVISLVLFGFLAFGIPILVGLAVGDFLFSEWEMIVAFVWLAIAPALIDAFELTIDSFWSEYERRVELSTQEFLKLRQEMNRSIFSRRYLILSVVFYLGFFLIMGDVLAGHSPIMVAVVDILMIPAALMWGIIAHVATAIYPFMRKVCKEQVRLNVFHPDGFGGLGSIGDVALRVTAFVSSVSLYIPFGFSRAGTENPLISFAALMCLLILMLGIMTTFLMTVLPVNRLAKKHKERLLDSLGKNLWQRLECFGERDTRMEQDVELLLVLESYREIRSMRVWPFDPKNAINIFGLLLLPVILFLAGIFL